MAKTYPKQPSSRLIDLTGQQFARLTVLSRAPNSGKGTAWHVQCVCGNSLIVPSTHLRTQHTKSCGCLSREITRTRATTHGMTGGGKPTPTYLSWQNMRRRCLNPDEPGFQNYGGRGITICARWQNFAHFLADMGERPPGPYSLERRNNHKGYSPNNCYWATRTEQNNNKRSNVRLTYHGITLNLTQWAERVDISQSALFARIQRGWSIERALTTPLNDLPKIQCLHGHEFTSENTRIRTRKGHGISRGCRTCEYESGRRQKARARSISHNLFES